MMKGLIAILLLIASGSVVLAGDAPIPDEPLPQEVRKLVGMKIPTDVVGSKGKYIPRFIRFGSGMLNRKIGNEVPKAELVYEEGLINEKWSVFMVSAMNENGVLEILDARLLPKDEINWRYANGKITRLEDGDFLIFSPYCQYENNEDRIIFGLEDPKYERDNYSTRIERAWEIDPQTGRIKSISTQGVICAILGE